MDDLVHLQVQICVLVREALCEELLVKSGKSSQFSAQSLIQEPPAQIYISCVLWYAQKPNARPAHSMMVFGSKPLSTLVL